MHNPNWMKMISKRCLFLTKSEWGIVDSTKFLSDSEEVMAILKSNEAEFCFTNRSLVLSIVKPDDEEDEPIKQINRFDYFGYPISGVEMIYDSENDIILSFYAGEISIRIAINRSVEEEALKLFKVLTEIATIIVKNEYKYKDAQKSLKFATSAMALTTPSDFLKILNESKKFMLDIQNEFIIEDFKYVFEQHFSH